jgi:hypothetical protein
VPGLSQKINAPDRPNVLTGKKSQKNGGSHIWDEVEKNSLQPDDLHGKDVAV